MFTLCWPNILGLLRVILKALSLKTLFGNGGYLGRELQDLTISMTSKGQLKQVAAEPR